MFEPYIETVTGRKVHFLHPEPDEIDIKDIAFSLSNQCRFNGHVQFYSVAEHSVMVSAMCPEKDQLAALLHDASEAYLSDIPSPVKQYLPDYKAIEETVQKAINDKFNVNTFTENIKYADKKASYQEATYLLDSRGRDWVPVLFQPQQKFKPHCLTPKDAFVLFMDWYNKLTEPLESKLIISA